ncbi:hypothetical protein CH289_07610 [Rhodococcus sp. RS1C4]|nr:peptidoglycan-binding protein [Rhodococcus sp. RS1C4]OZC55052.1 hypothetical protein CH289_07610 [Rhodococcus sp. RS1C4]
MTRSAANAIPRDAVFRAGFQHGGGGPYSHTACTIEHANWESRGTPGVLYGSSARAWNDGLFNEYWSIAGPVVNDLAPHDFPLPNSSGVFFYYGPYDGPENSISGKAGEPANWIDGLKRWQAAAGIVQDGQYGPATAQKAREIQRNARLIEDGKIGPQTWALVVKPGGSPVAPTPSDPLVGMSREDRIFHELTYRFKTRVETSGYTDTAVGYLLQIDKASYLNGVELKRQGELLDAIAKKLEVSV